MLVSGFGKVLYGFTKSLQGDKVFKDELMNEQDAALFNCNRAA